MAPKRAKVTRGSYYSSSNRSISRFVRESDNELYEAAKLHRNPHPEKGFDFSEVLET